MTTVQSLLQGRNRKKDQDLHQRSSISAERIEELSRGAEPNLEELRTLADFFRIDLHDLLPPHPRHQSFGFLFRAGGKEVDEVTSSTLSRRIGYSMDLLDAPGARYAWWTSKFSRRNLSYEDAEANAETFRKLFLSDDQLSPIFGLADLAAEALGVFLFLVRTA